MDGELEQLGERIAEQAAHLDAATHRLLTDLRTFDERGGWHVQGALSCAHWLSWRVGWTLGTARDHVRVARKLADVPTIDDALRRGEVSYAKVRAMVRIATAANELLLLDYARFMTGSQLEQTCRKYALVLRHGQDPHPLGDLQRRYVRRRDTEDGMVKIEAVLHPDEAELVWTMLNHAAKQLIRTPAPTAVSPQAESTSPDVSAETRAHLQAPASSTASTAMSPQAESTSEAESISSDVSAETRAHLQAPAPSTASTATSPAVESTSDVEPTAGDVSAETRAHLQASAPSTASTTVSPRVESTSSDVSAETRAHLWAPAPSTASTAMSPQAESIPPHVSAETRALLRAPAPGTASTATSPQVEATSEVESTSHDVSAETRAHLQAPARGTASAVTSPQVESTSEVEPTSPDVSAETRAHLQAPASSTASIVMSPQAESTSADVSAETCARPHRGDAHSFDAPERQVGKSLLDELLDQTELLRAAEPAVTPEVESARAEPRSGAELSVLQQQADATRRAFSRADALVSLAQRFLRGERPNRSPVEVVLTIPASSLQADAMDPVEVGEIGESFVSREAARRLSCDSGLVEIVEDEHGAPLSVGRKRRTITGSLKRALLQRDKTCTFPGCTNHLYLEGHHIQHWADGGETSLSNATLLCTLHHHYVHEYGYTIELGSDQRPQFRDPHGRLVAAVPGRIATPDLGWPRIREMNEPLEIDAQTIACKWDGMPVNYGAVIGHLVIADGLQ